MANPTLNDLRALALALPPSERVSGAEAGDVLSALIAVQTHGDGLLEAAQKGDVPGFYHDAAVAHAEANDHPTPERGQVTAPAAPAEPVAQPGAPALDYDKLAQAIVNAQQNAKPTQASEPVHEPPPSSTPLTNDEQREAGTGRVVSGEVI